MKRDHHFFFFAMVLLLSQGMCLGQSISGSPTATVGSASEYSFFDDTYMTSPGWDIQDGTYSSWVSGSTYYASVTFTSEGTKTVAFYDGSTLKASMEVYVSPCIAPTPSGSFTYASSTTGVTITRTGSPPYGYTWFWQTSSSGTSTSNSSTTFTGTAGNIYYLRARDNNYMCWSSVSLATATIPATPSLTNGVGCAPGPVSVTMSATAGSGGTTVRWYANASGGSVLTTGSSYSPSLSSTTTYYAVSYNSSNGAEGLRFAIIATVQTRPSAAGSDQAICSGTTSAIALSNPNSVTPTPTYSWTVSQSNVTGASNASGSTIAQILTATALEGTATYTVTASSNGCAGSAVNIVARVTATPIITTNGPNPLVHGTPTQLSANTSYTSFQWKNAAGDISGQTASSFVIPFPSTYRVNVKSSANSAWCLSAGTVATAALSAQGTSVGLVSTTTIFKEGVTDAVSLYTLQPNEIAQVNQYSDGLGRVFQTVATGAAPGTNKGDLVSHIGFGKDGVTDTTFLPYATTTSSGAVHRYAVRNSSNVYTQSEQYLFYQGSSKVASDTMPFAKSVNRSAPDMRLTEQGAPGSDWQPGDGHTVRNTLTLNTTIYPVRFWKQDGTTTGNYTSKSVAVAITTDENGNKVRTYTNGVGQTVLKQVELGESIGGQTVSWLETYYVYDDYGRLKYQVPPKAVAILDGTPNLETDTNLAELIYKYTYDSRGRLVEKKEPGAVVKYLVYDIFDRLVLTQDGKLRSLNKWAYVKYDVYGRTVYTGLYTNSGGRSSVQKWVEKAYTASSSSYPEANYVEYKQSGLDSLHGYSNVSFPKDSIFRLAVSYYDTYDFNATGTLPFTYDNNHITGLPTAASANVRGMATGSKVRLLGPTGNVTANWIKGAVFYDCFDRVIQTQSNNHLNLNAVDTSSVLYNNIRRVEKTKLTHTAQSVTTSITQRNDYDHAGRVLKTYHQVNTNTEVLAVQYEYNALGQMVDKKLHSTSGSDFLQSVDYRYNIRGWLASINNAQLSDDTGATNDDAGDYFGMELAYSGSVSGLSNTAYYNGNISAIKWKGPGASGKGNQRSYKYSYDKSDKLKAATFQAYDAVPQTWTNESNTLNESITYDHGGNILTLARKRNNRTLAGTNTAATVDNLSYAYAANSNMLTSVQDTDTAGWFKNPVSTGSEYAHNNDGSLTRDDNKGISSITYNFLGKPQVVNFTSGKKVEYVYDAAGIKLTVKTWQSATLESCTNYTGGFVYEGSTPALSHFSSPEGRVVKNGSTYEYQYAIADHQGNTRVVFTSVTPATQSYTATFENATQTTEQANFQNYPSGGNRSSLPLYDHTDSGGSTYSNLLNGGYSSQVGLAKSFKVYPGDKVSIRAFAKYMSSSGSSNLSGFATSLLAAFGYGSPPAGGETGTAKAALNSWGGMVAGGNGNEDNDDHPKAFVNLLVFDRNYNLLDMGWDQINGGKQVGVSPDVAHDTLYQEYVAREEGYVFAYLSNENATLADVYFDDVTLTLTPGRVIQGNEYYPFGVQTAASWTRESALTNNFLYNGGTELNKTTQVYDLYYRNYDPVLGRFGQVDPMASSHGPLSPYHFGLNNPARFNDPLGDDEYDSFLRFNVMNGSYVAGGSGGNSMVYRDMDPYGVYKTARFFAQSVELQTMQRDAKSMTLDDFAAKYGTVGYLFESWTHWVVNGTYVGSDLDWKVKSGSGQALWSSEENTYTWISASEVMSCTYQEGALTYHLDGGSAGILLPAKNPIDVHEANYSMNLKVEVFEMGRVFPDRQVSTNWEARVSAYSFVSTPLSGGHVFAQGSVTITENGTEIGSYSLNPRLTFASGEGYVGMARIDLPNGCSTIRLNFLGSWTYSWGNDKGYPMQAGQPIIVFQGIRLR